MAREIASLLSSCSFNTSEGRNKFCKNFDFTYQLNGATVDMVVTSVLGHVLELDFSGSYANWQSPPPESLFSAPLVAKVGTDMKSVAANLQSQARQAQMLIIWTDCDREGEYIGSEIVQICCQANSRLDVYRAQYSVVSGPEFHRALSHLRRLDQGQVDAVCVRSELDLRTGAAFTRLQTLELQKPPFQIKSVVSYGPCQFPTLGFVVEQYLRVLRFVPQSFWFLEVEVLRNGISTKFSWDRGRLFDRLICLAIYEHCLEHPQMTIQTVNSRPTSKWRPLPLRTVELQKAGARLLRLSSDLVMKVAEGLYNRGHISYPRTETDMFEAGFDLQGLVGRQLGHPEWGAYASRLAKEGGFRMPRKGSNNDKAHPPIHPTKEGQSLTGNDKRVYEFITRRFLACCSEDAKGLETTVAAKIGSETFRAKGVIVTERNYLDVYVYENWNDKEIGCFNPGESLVPEAFLMKAGETTPPKLLTEGDLIGSMDKNGIGTDATIHEHIKKILERGYAVKTGHDNRFLPTVLGLAIVEGYDAISLDFSLTRPRLRAMMESDLAMICQSRKTKEAVLDENKSMFQDAFFRVKAREIAIAVEIEITISTK